MKYYYLFVVCFLHLLSLKAQDSILISGTVSEDNGSPIPHVNIIAEGNKVGVASDHEGYFELRLPRQRDVVRFSHLSFQEKKLVLDLSQESRDTLYLAIVLQTKVEKLTSLDLIDSNILKAQQGKNTQIKDFEFYKEGLLLLVEEGASNKLKYINTETKTVFDLPVKKGGLRIEKDCHDNFYIAYKKWMFQLIDQDASPSLVQSYTTKEYEAKIAPCKVASEDFLYFNQYEKHNQLLIYYQWDEKNQQVTPFASLFDPKTFANADGEAKIIETLSTIGPCNHKIHGSIDSHKAFYNGILTQALYAPLLPLGEDKMVLFNHTIDSMLVYNRNGVIEDRLPISYHKLKGWEEVLMDDNGKFAYAKCIRNGIAFLYEIDLSTGRVGSETQIAHHNFPKALKIRNGVVYYLYKSPGYFTKTNLYHQKLASASE